MEPSGHFLLNRFINFMVVSGANVFDEGHDGAPWSIAGLGSTDMIGVRLRARTSVLTSHTCELGGAVHFRSK